ncbi:hypothetical protein ES708_35053 [subsurface metagenome]
MDHKKTSEVEIAAIHDIHGTGFDYELIEDIDIVNASVSNDNHGGNTATQIQEGMHLDCSLSFAEYCPRKQGKTQIDGGGIQGVDCLIQFHAEAFVGVQSPGLSDEHLGEVGVDAPVSDLVGIGQGIAGDVSTNAHMVELVSRSSETCLDIPQAFSVSELSKGHAEKLVPAGKSLDLVIAVVAGDAFAKFVNRKEFH